MAEISPRDVPVFVLCGGMGTRIKEETEFRPKPMVPIGGSPILLHIMKCYASHGFKRFILCLGYKGNVIKDYFLNYSLLHSDFTVGLEQSKVEIHQMNHTADWSVTMASTGEKTMTGGRIARALKRYLGDSSHFAVTYGDGLTDVDLGSEFAFHRDHGRIGTVLGVNPPSRFGELQVEGDAVRKFSEKPDFRDSWINGGFFFFRREFADYVSEDEACILELEPLSRLAADGELSIYRHRGFWKCMDTQRDRDELEAMWSAGDVPWDRVCRKGDGR